MTPFFFWSKRGPSPPSPGPGMRGGEGKGAAPPHHLPPPHTHTPLFLFPPPHLDPRRRQAAVQAPLQHGERQGRAGHQAGLLQEHAGAGAGAGARHGVEEGGRLPARPPQPPAPARRVVRPLRARQAARRALPHARVVAPEIHEHHLGGGGGGGRGGGGGGGGGGGRARGRAPRLTPPPLDLSLDPIRRLRRDGRGARLIGQRPACRRP